MLVHGCGHAPSRRRALATAASSLLTPILLLALTWALAGCSGSSSAQTIVYTPAPFATATPTPPPTATPTASPAPTLSADVQPPTDGKWIEVDVTHFVVRLMDGRQVVKEIAPVAVGAQIDTGAYASTQTGLFHVYNKIAPLSYDAPYKTYIQWWVGFDPQKANGFHSFLLDKNGHVVDGSTGRVSSGCIRTGDPKALFDFAQVGMPVLVHT